MTSLITPIYYKIQSSLRIFKWSWQQYKVPVVIGGDGAVAVGLLAAATPYLCFLSLGMVIIIFSGVLVLVLLHRGTIYQL